MLSIVSKTIKLYFFYVYYDNNAGAQLYFAVTYFTVNKVFVYVLCYFVLHLFIVVFVRASILS